MTQLSHCFTDECILWLQSLLRERISTELSLSFCTQDQQWVISINPTSTRVVIPIIANLYTVGPSHQLPCINLTLPPNLQIPRFSHIPAPGLSNPPCNLVQRTQGDLIINYDLLGLAYWKLTLCEEHTLEPQYLDEHLRFNPSLSHACKFNYSHIPIVDFWFYFLRAILLQQWSNLSIHNHTFTVHPSHDIDLPSRFTFINRKKYLKNCLNSLSRPDWYLSTSLSPIIRLSGFNVLNRFDPYNNSESLCGLSNRYSLKSTFFFKTGWSHPYLDAKYTLAFPSILRIANRIVSSGHTIGIHPSYQTSEQHSALVDEINAFKTISAPWHLGLLASRMHYLRWSHPNTGLQLSALGVTHDSTLGYASFPGFRCGTCFQYQMFNPISSQRLSLIQQPLNIMDTSLFNSKYLNLSCDAALQTSLDIANSVKAVSGQLRILVHNNLFTLSPVYRWYTTLLRLIS